MLTAIVNWTDEGLSLPVRGAWIEMRKLPPSRPKGLMSLPVRGAWIEIFWEKLNF